MGIGGILLGLFCIGMGIVMLAFPDVYRSLNKFSNDMEGVQTEHGTPFEINRMIGGVVLIALGIVALFVLS